MDAILAVSARSSQQKDAAAFVKFLPARKRARLDRQSMSRFRYLLSFAKAGIQLLALHKSWMARSSRAMTT